MNEPTITLMKMLTEVVKTVNVGTNLGLLYLLWMIISGQLLSSRGAVIPGLSKIGISDAAVRRSWRALAKGGWKIGELLVNWERCVMSSGHYEPRSHGGYSAVAVDLVGFYRPRLKKCPTKHYDHQAGKALPAIVLGILGRVGKVGSRRFLLPLEILRVAPENPSETGLMTALIEKFKVIKKPWDVLVGDGGFPLDEILEATIPFVLKVAKNFKARRPEPPAYCGRGTPPTRGEVVRPLARTYGDKTIAATPPDRQVCWREADGTIVCADLWDNLLFKDMDLLPDAPRFSVLAIYHPNYKEPWLLAHNLPLDPAHIYLLYRDRWPIEHPPLVAKTLLGAHRAFVHSLECCHRLPELALLAGSILTFVAALLPPIPTGFWDLKPKSTPGRLRRFLEQTPFPLHFPLPAEIRQKSSPTHHLQTGFNVWLFIKSLHLPLTNI